MRFFLLVLLTTGFLGCSSEPVTINQLQFIGSHNSYKLAMDDKVMAQLTRQNPDAARSLDYSHSLITDQLDMGIRKLELDVFFDEDSDSLVVGHVQQIDMNSSCTPLDVCFDQILTWSQANSSHVPIWISFNAKDQRIQGLPVPDVFSDHALELLDREIQRSFEGKLIWPKDVNGLSWPEIEDARGKFLFILDEGGTKQEQYLRSWKSRPMFVPVAPPHPAAAILIINDPIKNHQKIAAMVGQGFMVRTRADADTIEARIQETNRKGLAITSGAQAVSTDYYLPSAHFDSTYRVEPFIRCNPINTGKYCRFVE